MNLNDRQKKAATYGIIGVVAFLTGTVLPPEVISGIMEAF